VAWRNDVAALGHGHAQRDHLLALVSDLDLGRIDVAAMDSGDIAQAQLHAGAAPNGHRSKLLDGLELARHPHLHHVTGRLHRAGRFDRVLLPQLGDHLGHVEPELGQAALGDLKVQAFVLHAKEFDLGHIGYPQQLLSHVVGEGLALGPGEAGAGL
jgi:hypothetical protein